MNKDEILRDLAPSEETLQKRKLQQHKQEQQEKEQQEASRKPMKKISPPWKSDYGPKVKVDKWWYYRETLPVDYDTSGLTADSAISTYNRLGTYPEGKDFWKSETMYEMEKGLGDPKLALFIKQSQPRPMLTFLSYPRTLKTRKDLVPDEIRMILPTVPKELLKMRYKTTYSSCYKFSNVTPGKCFPEPEQPEPKNICEQGGLWYDQSVLSSGSAYYMTMPSMQLLFSMKSFKIGLNATLLPESATD